MGQASRIFSKGSVGSYKWKKIFIKKSDLRIGWKQVVKRQITNFRFQRQGNEELLNLESDEIRSVF